MSKEDCPVSEYDGAEQGEVVHMCPPEGEPQFPCCDGWPLERLADRMTLDPNLVTCPGRQRGGS